MKVAVLTKHFPNSQQKWAGHSAYQTLRVLATMCDLHVFYPEATYPKFLMPPGGPRHPLDLTWSPQDITTTYILYPAVPGISRPLNGFSITRRLLPHIRRFAPDIILSYFIYPDGYAAVNIGKTLGIPAVVTAVGSDINRIPDVLCRRLTQTTLRHAAFVSAVSEDLCAKARTLGAGPDRSRTKLNGCDTTVFYPQDARAARQSLNLDPDAETIVYVGRLDLRKGLMELVHALAQLAPTRPSLRTYLVGDGPARTKLLEAIATHDLADRIILVPACPTAQVATWMAAATLVTLPSYNEGCPNVVVESLAAGRPVVATNVGGIPELLDDTCGHMVPPRDIPALANALAEVLNQPWDASAIAAKHGRSWNDVACDLYQILEQVVQQQSMQLRAS